MPGPQYGVPGDALPRMSTWRPQWRERRAWTRKDALTVLVLVALVVACIGALGWIAKKEGTPDGEVRRYLTYLAQGDAEGALSMVDPGVPNDQRLFLTNEVMASASSHLIIESVEAEDNGGKRVDSSTVTATMRLDGDRFTHVFTVERAKGNGAVSAWTLRDGLFVTLPVSGSRVPQFSVGGVVADLDPSVSKKRDFLFFPGVYTVEPEGVGAYVTAPSQQVVIEDGSHDSPYETTALTLQGALSAELKTEALQAMQDAVQACATQGTNMADSCPSALHSSSLSVLEVSKLPSALVSATEDGSYTGEDGAIRYQDTGGWFPDRSPHDLTVRPTATVATTEGGIPVVTLDGKPVFSVTLSVPWF